MSRRLGNHRVRPSLSNAAKAKAEIKSLEARRAAAIRKGDMVVSEKLRSEIAWLTVNSLVP